LRLGDNRSKKTGEENGMCVYKGDEGEMKRQNLPIVLDIGANAGIYGMYASALGGCTTYFFDIQEECQKWIGQSIVKNRFTDRAYVPSSLPSHLYIFFMT
jgi:hypothetical protein